MKTKNKGEHLNGVEKDLESLAWSAFGMLLPKLEKK
jgi:hypothetical protein